MISTSGGKIASDRVVKDVSITLGSTMFPTELICLDDQEIDIILGMPWMKRHMVVLDIANRSIEIDFPSRGTFTLIFPSSIDPIPNSYSTVTSVGRHPSGL